MKFETLNDAERAFWKLEKGKSLCYDGDEDDWDEEEPEEEAEADDS